MSKYRVEYSLAHADLGALWKVTSPDHDIHYFHTWSNALAYANRMSLIFAVPLIAPNHAQQHFALWKIHRGLNVRANRKGTVELTLGKCHATIDNSESAIHLVKALLSATYTTWTKEE